MKRGKIICKTLLCFLVLSVSIWGSTPKTAEAAKTISATISSEKVEKGKTVKISTKLKSASYKSSDPSIAYVNQNGVVVGKKKGNVTITVSKEGYHSQTFTVTVLANGKTPNIYVWYEEIELVEEEIKDGIYTAKIKNNSSEVLDQIEYVFSAEVETVIEITEDAETGAAPPEISDEATNDIADDTTNDLANETVNNTQNTSETHTKTMSTMTLNVTANQISGNGKTKSIKIEAPDNGKIKSIQLQEISVKSKSALIVYHLSSKSYTYGWGTKDKSAPVISGLVGKESYFDDTVFMVIYSDLKYDFKKYVSAEDDRDLKVALSVDTSKVNYKKEGTYKITYTAIDSAGNKTTADAKVSVRIPKKVDKMADEVLKELVNESMSDLEKATAVYTYIRKNFTYVGNYDEDSWEDAAMYGLKYKSGDCFMYYSVSKLLLTRLGFPNMMIQRYRGEGHHWWNLVYTEGGWYHFDSTPRSIMATFCMVTSAQLEDYSKSAGNSHIWDITKYPKTATKKISKVVMKKRY